MDGNLICLCVFFLLVMLIPVSFLILDYYEGRRDITFKDEVIKVINLETHTWLGGLSHADIYVTKRTYSNGKIKIFKQVIKN